MSKVERRRWQSSLDGGLSRKDRQGCEYEAYVPDPLGGREFRLDGTVAADVADAERAIATLDASAGALANTEAFTALERQLAGPAGDTHTAPPDRPAPARPY